MFVAKYTIILILVSTSIGSGRCEYYTSVHKLEALREFEGRLLDTLKDLQISPEEPGHDRFKSIYTRIREEHVEASVDPSAYIGNPVSAIKLIKRFVYDWTYVEEYIKGHGQGTHKEFQRLLLDGFNWPTEQDLVGAANGLTLLQETYDLDIGDLAEGRILDKDYSSPMSVNDCSSIGLSLYRAGNYSRSLPWFLISLDKIRSSPGAKQESITELIRYLSVVYFQIGDPKMALLLTNDILQNDPTNEDLLANKRIFTKKLLEDRASKKVMVISSDSGEAMEAALGDKSFQLCRGELHQTPRQQRSLRCMYTNNGVPYRLLHPFKAEQLNLDPLVMLYHHVLTDKQIKEAINEASQNLERSRVYGETVSSTNERTSQQSWLSFQEHKFPRTIADTLNHMTGLSLTNPQPIQLVNYGIGGYYKAHHDFVYDVRVFGTHGNRLATALAFISDVDLGGATGFVHLNLTVKPEKGSFLFWYNLHESLEVDYRTAHVACPVLKGSKWILTEWFHEREQMFTKPCSLQQKGHLSLGFQNAPL